MRNRCTNMTLALAIVLGCSSVASAQTTQPSNGAHAPTPRATPDISGVWMKDRPPATTGLEYWVYQFNLEEPPMTAWGEAQYKATKSSLGPHGVPLAETNDPVYHGCFPPGVPRIFLYPVPMQIVQVPGEVIMLFEYDSKRRQIFTDGRPHDTSLGPLWMGDSIGHWESDTLVVDTASFNDKTWLDSIGHAHSEDLHVLERIRRISHDRLSDDITIEDPKAYTRPWTAHLDFVLKPTWTLAERFCEDDASFQEIENKETTPAK